MSPQGSFSCAEAPTIFALSSAAGRAGVAVIRVSGFAARESLVALTGSLPKPRVAALRILRDRDRGDGLQIDQALVLWFPAPHSFTGEDIVEFQIHGGRAVVAALLAALGQMENFRLAEPGEFARRAFLNGKLDLTKAEGLADLINADTEAQRAQAIVQTSGGLDRQMSSWRGDIIKALSMIEAAIDFSDEADIADEISRSAWPIATTLRADIAQHLDDGHRGEIIRDGYRVVIAGPPNAGKSSLMNALAQRDVAIVSKQAGTTRDIIEVRLDLGGFAVVLSDTAGIREKAGEIEREGIRRAMAHADAAQLIIWLHDGETGASPLPDKLTALPHKVIEVHSKADLLLENGQSNLRISAQTGAGLQALTEVIRVRASGDNPSGQADPLITRARHRQELTLAFEALQNFVAHPDNEIELCAEDLRRAARALGRVTGEVDVEDILGQIFGEFCIGK